MPCTVCVLTAGMATQQVIKAANTPTIRLLSTKAAPALPLATGHTWHLFLSHIWSTGQDQCATIKRQLAAMLPGVAIFLDAHQRLTFRLGLLKRQIPLLLQLAWLA